MGNTQDHPIFLLTTCLILDCNNIVLHSTVYTQDMGILKVCRTLISFFSFSVTSSNCIKIQLQLVDVKEKEALFHHLKREVLSQGGLFLVSCIFSNESQKAR